MLFLLRIEKAGLPTVVEAERSPGLDENIENQIRMAGQPVMKIDAATLATVAKGDGRVLSLVDLGFPRCRGNGAG